MSVACFMLLAYESGMLEEINGVIFLEEVISVLLRLPKQNLTMVQDRHLPSCLRIQQCTSIDATFQAAVCKSQQPLKC